MKEIQISKVGEKLYVYINLEPVNNLEQILGFWIEDNADIRKFVEKVNERINIK